MSFGVAFLEKGQTFACESETRSSILSQPVACQFVASTSLQPDRMSIADQVQGLMDDILRPEPSPKRRRLDSNSPQSSDENDRKPHHDTADVDNGYAFEEESDMADLPTASNSQTPRERDQQTDDSRPLGVHYKPYMTLRGHKRGVAAVRFSPNGKWIASCCEESDRNKRYSQSD
jgi:WD40 repeat protein